MGYSAIPCDTENIRALKAIDYSDRIARLDNSHGRATATKGVDVHKFSSRRKGNKRRSGEGERGEREGRDAWEKKKAK